MALYDPAQKTGSLVERVGMWVLTGECLKRCSNDLFDQTFAARPADPTAKVCDGEDVEVERRG
jgi:hypothetical protein